MSIRINTAIGWGMSFETFQKTCLFDCVRAPISDEWYQDLETALEGTSSMRGPIGLPLPITGPDDSVYDLLEFVGYDDCSHVILMPSMHEARKWHRRDDSIDYAFHIGTPGPRNQDIPGDIVEYMPYGHHPYGDIRMNPDGTDAPKPDRGEYEEIFTWENDDGLLPGVPGMMRHWIDLSGLLGLEGIAALRPVRAKWWS